MALSLRKETGPIIEGLKESKDLRSTVTAGAASQIYPGQPWRDHVERPSGENSWSQLAEALGRLNPELNRMAAVHEQRFFEEQTAEGERLMRDSEKKWEDFVKENPEYAGLNPHLERGYKAAQLRSKGQLMSAALQDKYLTEGWANETDPAKVQTMTQDFIKEWQAANINPADYDAKIWADNFLPTVQQLEAGIMDKNTGDRAREHLDRAFTAHSNEARAQIEAAVATMDYKNPAAFGQTVSAIFQNKMDEMTRTGLPMSKVRTALMETIYNLASAEGEEGYGDELLEAAKAIKIGTGTLGGLPEFKLEEKKIKDRWKQQRDQDFDAGFRRQQRERTLRENAAHDALNGYLYDVELKGETASLEEMLRLAGPQSSDIALSKYSSYRGLEQNPINWTTEKQIDFDVHMQLAYRGKVDMEQANALYAAYGNRTREITEIVRKTQEGNDPVTNALRSAGVGLAFDTLAAQIQATGESSGATEGIVRARVVEASRILRNKVRVYVEEGERTQKPRTQAEIELFTEEEARKLGKDPAYREFTTGRDILSPQDVEDRKTEEYWTDNTAKLLGDEREAKAIVNDYIRNRQRVVRQVAAAYNIPPELVDIFVGNQARLYGLDLPALQTEYTTTLQTQEQQARINRLRDSRGLSVLHPEP